MTPVIDGLILLLGGSVAASIVAKATVIIAAGLVGARLSRRRRTAVRHAVLAASFAALLALPVVSIFVSPLPIAVPAVTTEPAVPPPFTEVVVGTESDVPPDTQVSIASAISRVPAFSFSALLYAGWLAGTLFFLARMIVGLRQVHSLRRFGLRWRGAQPAVDRLALNAGIHRRVEVLLHESLPAPVTCGVVHPAIVFPPDAQNWDEDDLKRAIIHELEHVRRCDWMSHCFARIVRAVYWFHPLVWIAWRQLALEAERSCDDAVLHRSEATAYADQLVELARRLSAVRKSPALAMANRSDLSARVGSVLDGRQQRGRAGAVLVAVACTVAALLVLTVSPISVVAAPQSGSDQTAGRPAFEVASVKPSPPPELNTLGIGLSTYPGGRILAHNCTLHLLIMFAFDSELFQFPNAPAWINDDAVRFDLEARPPASSPSSKANPPYPKAPPNNEQRQMLLTLLIERFGLKFHIETKEGPVYLLVKGSGSLKLHEPKDQNVFPWAGTVNGGPVFASGMAGTNISMEQLAKRLTPVVGRPVLDKTGLKGSFDFKTENAQTEYAPFDPNLDRVASILTSLKELGLKLDASKAQVETIVIDHAEKPSEN